MRADNILSYDGPWIKMVGQFWCLWMKIVASYMGAWIKITFFILGQVLQKSSHPSRLHGCVD